MKRVMGVAAVLLLGCPEVIGDRCGPDLPPCPSGTACVNEVCQSSQGGGSAAGGSAAGGSTAGGNAAGGNAAGGNAAGGNAAGGNAAGGNAAGGTTAIDGGYGPSGTWTRLADFPDPRYYASATFSLDGRLFVFGGRAASTGDLDSVEVYFPPPANTWVPAPIMPMPRSGTMALTLADGGIVVMGGSNGGRMPMLFFNVFTGQWTMGSQGLNERELAAFSMTPNGDWYVAGGGGFKATAERYSPAQGAWSALPSLPFGLSTPGGGADSQGRLYAFGGYPNVNGATVLNFQLAPDAGAWTQVTSMPVAKGRFGNSVTDPQGRFYVVGGSADIFAGIGAGVVESSVERYDPATNSWDTVTPMPVPRCNHAVAIDAQGRVFVIGGHTGASALSTRVDVYNP